MRAIRHLPKDNVAAVDEKVEAGVDDDEEVVDGDHVARPVRKVCKGVEASKQTSFHSIAKGTITQKGRSYIECALESTVSKGLRVLEREVKETAYNTRALPVEEIVHLVEAEEDLPGVADEKDDDDPDEHEGDASIPPPPKKRDAISI